MLKVLVFFAAAGTASADVGPSLVAGADRFVKGMTAFQFCMVLFAGAVTVVAIIRLVGWLVDQKMGELPQDIKEIKMEIKDIGREINDIRLQQTRLDGKMWTKEDIRDSILQESQKELAKHMERCPAVNKMRSGA